MIYASIISLNTSVCVHVHFNFKMKQFNNHIIVRNNLGGWQVHQVARDYIAARRVSRPPGSPLIRYQ